MNESRPLFRVASRGVAWSMVASATVLLASSLAQFVLGLLLDETDYAVYALAYASSDFLVVFRDGGVQLWLSRLDTRRFRRFEGHAFWLATVCSVVTSLLLVALALVVSRPEFFDDSRIRTYLLVLASAFPWTAYSSVAQAKLQVELRFRTMAIIKVVSGITRHGLVITLAYFGWGALSFAIAFFAIVFLELVAYYLATRIQPWRTRFSLRRSCSIFRSARWSVGGALATAVLRQSDYVVLGLIASKVVVGCYFFAYQIAMQPVMLFSESLRRVVLPTFSSRFKGVADQARLLRYVGVFVGGIATTGMVGLAVVAAPLEAMLWGGRWARSVPAIEFFSLVMPLHLAGFVVEMVTQSQGRFRLWTSAVLLRGLGFGAAAGLAGVLGETTDPGRVAAVVSVYIGVSAILQVVYMMRQLGASPLPFFASLLPPYLCALAVAVPWIYGDWLTAGSPVVHFFLRGFGFVGLLAALWTVVCPDIWKTLWTMGKRFAGKIDATG